MARASASNEAHKVETLAELAARYVARSGPSADLAQGVLDLLKARDIWFERCDRAITTLGAVKAERDALLKARDEAQDQLLAAQGRVLALDDHCAANHLMERQRAERAEATLAAIRALPHDWDVTLVDERTFQRSTHDVVLWADLLAVLDERAT